MVSHIHVLMKDLDAQKNRHVFIMPSSVMVGSPVMTGVMNFTVKGFFVQRVNGDALKRHNAY